jgi:hypothetical protein
MPKGKMGFDPDLQSLVSKNDQKNNEYCRTEFHVYNLCFKAIEVGKYKARMRLHRQTIQAFAKSGFI